MKIQHGLSAVHRISQVLSSTLDLEDRLSDVLTVSMQAVNAIAGSILLYEPTKEALVFRYVVGEKARELTGVEMATSEGLAGAVFLSGEAQITNRPHEAVRHRADVGESVGFQTESIVTVPLKYQTGNPVGVMQILNKQEGEFEPSDLEVLEIVASVAAAAIENARLAREAQFAAVAHAVGDLSHDIKNKVAPISGWVETLQPMMEEMFQEIDQEYQNVASGPAVDTVRTLYPEGFDAILHQVRSVQEYTKLIADALKGSISEPQLELMELTPVIEVQLKELETVARNGGVQILREFGPIPVCRFDRFQVERAVYNLVNNALPETPSGGSVTIRTQAVTEGQFPDGQFVAIEVADTGRGMPSHVLERILRGNPRSTKKNGTGLGTRIVYNAVAAHRGVFEGESQEAVGTTFRMKIPLLIT